MLRIAVPNKGSLAETAAEMLSEAGYVVWLSELRPAITDLLEQPLETTSISRTPA